MESECVLKSYWVGEGYVRLINFSRQLEFYDGKLAQQKTPLSTKSLIFSRFSGTKAKLFSLVCAKADFLSSNIETQYVSLKSNAPTTVYPAWFFGRDALQWVGGRLERTCAILDAVLLSRCMLLMFKFTYEPYLRPSTKDFVATLSHFQSY